VGGDGAGTSGGDYQEERTVRVSIEAGMTDLDPIQRAAREQFGRQSARYGESHILADVEDVKAVLARMPSTKPGRSLDVATGGGHTGIHLASLGWQVTLSDISAEMLERAKALAGERGFKVETRQHPAEAFPFEDECFYLVTCRVAPHHFSDPVAFIKETARVLRPGGHFILIDGSIQDDEPEAEEWLHQVEKLRDPSHNRLRSPRTWTMLCEEAGLKVEFAELHPFKQPDLNWYFETAATSPENRTKVLESVRNAPESARRLFRMGEEDGKIVWWWPRLSLLAKKP
jgi:ubiquinone/menaquinone biosynthesis C-methylase UbiE